VAPQVKVPDKIPGENALSGCAAARVAYRAEQIVCVQIQKENRKSKDAKFDEVSKMGF
jgi:hypothetical protein